MKEWQRERLACLLEAAAKKLLLIRYPIALPSFESAADMADFIFECRETVCGGTTSAAEKERLMMLFAPTSDWDDVIGDAVLANEILSLVDKL